MEMAVKTDGENAPVQTGSGDGYLGVTGWFSRSPIGRDASKKTANQKDTIPLQDYRNDTLQKIHAHSSAETSGLGDSLQRIHTLSSTETSGYGDGAPSPTHSPDFGRAGSWDPGHSPEVHGEKHNPRGDHGNPSNYHPLQDAGHNTINKGPSSDAIAHAHSPLGQRYYSGGYNPHQTAALPPERTAGGAESRADSGAPGGSGEQYSVAKRSVGIEGGHRWRVPGSVKSRDRAKFLEAARRARQNGADNGHDGGSARKFVTTMDTSSTTDGGSVSRVRSDPPKDHRPAGRHSRSGSVKSISSGNFLGSSTDSTWLKWSQDRRNSFKRRLDTIEMKQAELERNRVSTPVRKARKESVMFMSMSSKDCSYEDELEMQQIRLNQQMTYSIKTTTTIKDKKKGNQTVVEEVKLSMWQWNSLVAFWEHKIFVRSRYLGTILSILALVLEIIAVLHSDWHSTKPNLFVGATRAGLWYECVDLRTSGTNCTSINEIAKGRRDWQNAVIGLLIFSMAFGCLATILSVCGICAVTLAKKIYYYHSAGEIYLICALSCTAAMIVYPIALAMEKNLIEYSYGVGYQLGWGASFFFFAAATCMCLDDLVRTFAKGLCSCCRRSSSNKQTSSNTHTTSGV